MIQMVIEIDIVYYFHCDALIIYIYIFYLYRLYIICFFLLFLCQPNWLFKTIKTNCIT